jgi:hypothetical protein
LWLSAWRGGKQSAVEGKLVDWNGKPVAGVKITASQVQPLKGYEQFEAATRADGTFRLSGLFPSSAYVLKPWSDKWTCETAVRIESAPQSETSVLPGPMKIAQVFSKSSPSLVADIATGAVGRSAVEGKLVDWNGKPVAGVKIAASQVRPIKGYEQFETVTGEDGTFRLPNLLASSQYVLKPVSDKWSTKTSVSVDSPPHHGDTAMLPAPMQIAQAFSKSSGSLVIDLSTGATRFTVSSDGVITDSRTSLEWVVGPDRNTNYLQAEQWVAACSVAGGGWRMPTRQELRTLHLDGFGERNMDPAFKHTGWWVWAESRGDSAGGFGELAWGFGRRGGGDESTVVPVAAIGARVFGVRSRPRR